MSKKTTPCAQKYHATIAGMCGTRVEGTAAANGPAVEDYGDAASSAPTGDKLIRRSAIFACLVLAQVVVSFDMTLQAQIFACARYLPDTRADVIKSAI
jgi:hypothetical protein